MTAQREQKVLIHEHQTQCGRVFGQLTLNKSKALNALDLDMAKIMLNQLQAWQSRSDVLFVVIDSVGDKAFCAGGDIVSMYQAMAEQQRGIPAFIEAFFTAEYTLDHTIHEYSKPVVVWGDGIVMGGGMGLLQGASHRVVTERSRLAMPEITIGLFPDVGGSYFLPKLDNHLGLFLGLTAAQLNGAEASAYGMADYCCQHDTLDGLINNWQQTVWQHAKIAQTLTAALESNAPNSIPPDRVARWLIPVADACSASSAAEVKKRILAINNEGDPWLEKAQATLLAGSSLTAALFFHQFHKGESLSLADCFRMELTLACRCSAFGELQEGIRALLIDKDGAPAWRFDDIPSVPDDVLDAFFISPWEGNHPLAALGD